MSWGQLIKFTIIYFSIFVFIHIGLFLTLKILQKNFNENNLNKLIYTVSAQRPKTDNPCLNTFAKDPYTQNYYKIYIYCDNSNKAATNTIDLDAVTDKTIRGVVIEFARIMNFDPQLLLNSSCTSTQTGKAVDFDSMAVNRDTLKCLYIKNK